MFAPTNKPRSSNPSLAERENKSLGSIASIASQPPIWRPRRCLDLCCGEGLAAWGYWLSGRFHEIVGVDSNADVGRKYAFDFICGDALKLDYEFLSQFDFIHASPPCQAYSNLTPDKSKHPRLILPIKHMLFASGVPHVIENVPGSQLDLRPNLVISGEYFGLPSGRERYFYVSTLEAALRLIKPMPGANISGAASSHISTRHVANLSTRSNINLVIDDHRINVHGRDYVSRADVVKALGLECIPKRQLDRLSLHGMEQGVPPVFTRLVAGLVFSDKAMLL